MRVKGMGRKRVKDAFDSDEGDDVNGDDVNGDDENDEEMVDNVIDEKTNENMDMEMTDAINSVTDANSAIECPAV